MRTKLITGLLFALVCGNAAAQSKTVAEPAIKKVFKSSRAVPADVQYVFNRSLGAGRIKVVSDGTSGSVTTVTTRYYYQGKVIREEKSVETTAAKPTVIEISPKGFSGGSRGSYTRARVITMESTAYMPSDGVSKHGPFLTRTGRRTEFGVVAVDPRVIPLNSLLYVEGYGFAIAADTGGAIKGNKIDVCVMDHRTMNDWGRRKVKVHIFQGRYTGRS